MKDEEMFVMLTVSLILNIVTLICLFQPNIIYALHRHWFVWRANEDEGRLKFHKWMIENGWHEHSSKQYYYRSKDFRQWSPDEIAVEEELLRRFRERKHD